MLISQVLNLQPHICKAAVLEVPFVDPLGALLDTSLPLSIAEKDEWGDPLES